MSVLWDNLLGILGSEIINRFNFILDYKNKNLYLKANDLFYKDFEPLAKPIFFEYSNDRSEIIISNVMENTDAYKKGLKKGQTIISIDNIVSKDIYTYDQLLRKNRKIILKYVDDNNQIISVKIKLKN